METGFGALLEAISAVTLKLIAGRPEDRRDLAKLRIAHGELPEPLLDTQELEL